MRVIYGRSRIEFVSFRAALEFVEQVRRVERRAHLASRVADIAFAVGEVVLLNIASK